MYTINFWPILIAAISSFAVGALWYSPFLFGKDWLALMKISEKDIQDAQVKTMWKSYLAHFAANILSVAVLAFIIAISQASDAADGALLGLVMWLGFVVPLGVSNLLWRKDPLKLVLIDTFQTLASLIISGAIVGVWK